MPNAMHSIGQTNMFTTISQQRTQSVVMLKRNEKNQVVISHKG